MELKSYIRTVADWPKPGIMFRDITTLLADPEGFKEAIDALLKRYRAMDFDKIVAIESRGFVFGSVLARELNKPLVLVRKPGKLPAETAREEYELEYGSDAVEIHVDAINRGDTVLVIDDLLATGGTALATIRLCERLGATVAEAGFIIDLPDVGGSKRLREAGYEPFFLIEFEGD